MNIFLIILGGKIRELTVPIIPGARDFVLGSKCLSPKHGPHFLLVFMSRAAQSQTDVRRLISVAQESVFPAVHPPLPPASLSGPG